MFALKFAKELATDLADWVMMVDDDSYVNVPALLNFVKQSAAEDKKRDFFFGNAGLSWWTVGQLNENRFALTILEKDPTFPLFCINYFWRK